MLFRDKLVFPQGKSNIRKMNIFHDYRCWCYFIKLIACLKKICICIIYNLLEIEAFSRKIILWCLLNERILTCCWFFVVVHLFDDQDEQWQCRIIKTHYFNTNWIILKLLSISNNQLEQKSAMKILMLNIVAIYTMYNVHVTWKCIGIDGIHFNCFVSLECHIKFA